MKKENQCCLLEQAKRLNELGVIQGKSAFFFDTCTADKNQLQYNSGIKHGEGYKDAESCFSAFTVAELGVMLQGFVLPEYKQDYRALPVKKMSWLICVSPNNYPACAETEAEARAQFLIHLMEQKYLTAEEVNQRLLNS